MTTNSHLTIIDCRAERLNKFDWMVDGKIYKDADDLYGVGIIEGFDSCQIAANFVVNTLNPVR